jgi:small-conductance mechanosensitive channel
VIARGHAASTIQEAAMNGIIYIIGLIVVIMAILSFFGLR